MPWMLPAAVGGAGIVSGLIGASSAKSAANKQAAATESAVRATTSQDAQNRTDLAPYRAAGAAALTRLRSLMGLNDVNPPTMADAAAEHLNRHKAQFGIGYTEATPMDVVHRQVQDIYDQMQSAYQAKQAASPGTSGEDSLLRKFSTSDLNSDPVYNSGLQFGLDEGTKAIERRAAAGGGYDSGATLKGLVRFGNDYGSTKAADSYGRFTNDQDRTYGKLTGIAGMGSGATTVGVGAGTNTANNLANLYTGGGNAQGAAAIAGGNALAGGMNSIGQYAMLRQLTGGGQRTTTPSTNMALLGE